MNTANIRILALYAGLVVGAVAFALNWLVWEGLMPGYSVLLFPGNLTLSYLWHPLFTEEIDFWPKLALQLSGQFMLVAAFTALVTGFAKRLMPAQRP